ncbi:MAG: hypothetical protein ACM3VX_07695, partial [Bacteroidota bacterium]
MSVNLPAGGSGQRPTPGVSPLLVSWPPITVPIMTFTLPGWAPLRPPRPEVWSPAEPVADGLPLKLRWSRSGYAGILNQLRHSVFDSWRWWQLGRESYEEWNLPTVGCIAHTDATTSATNAAPDSTPAP